MTGPRAPLSPNEVRVSCDSAVALAPITRSGNTVFGKNSDRPSNEAQPLVQTPAADHAAGERVACQYIAIDQVEHTHGFVGSRPAWLWGVEHGVNEHGVAIGNHSIYTKDPVPASGLLGMDLVRLGLERGATADEAVGVIASLIEQHGQGGWGYADAEWGYHNSFLVADAEEAWLLEASGKNWARKAVRSGIGVSNHASITTDWDDLSLGCVEHAAANGWWPGGDARFDFAGAYRDVSVITPDVSSGRHRVTCQAVGGDDHCIDTESIKRVLRDHYESGDRFSPDFKPGDERYWGVCMHVAPISVTAASMTMELDRGRAYPSVCWVAFCNPCVGPFLPVLPWAEVPAELTAGTNEPGSGGAWWTLKSLLTAVEADYAKFAAPVREHWREFESELARRVERFFSRHDDLETREARDAAHDLMEDIWIATRERVGAALSIAGVA